MGKKGISGRVRHDKARRYVDHDGAFYLFFSPFFGSFASTVVQYIRNLLEQNRVEKGDQ
jgi:hypothetical protein